MQETEHLIYLNSYHEALILESLGLLKSQEKTSEEILSLIKKHFKNYNPMIRSLAAITFHSINTDSKLSVFINNLKNEEDLKVLETNSYVISEKLSKNPNIKTKDLNDLIKFSKKLSGVSKRHICFGLGYIKNKKSLKFLLDCVKSPIIDLRIIALESIIKHDEKSSLIEEILSKEKNEYVKLRFKALIEREKNNERTNSRNFGSCERSF